jgi:WD40 repeat protein/serine/threonine protein kinase
MTHSVSRPDWAPESISTSGEQSPMAKYVCTHCSHVIDDSPSQPLQCPACGHTFPIGDDSTYSGVREASTRIAIPVVPRHDFGRYRFEAELGGGGFGIVFKVFDPALDRSVAIKVPRPELLSSPDALARFTREGKSAARLKHARIVRVLTVEQIGEMPCIVSEFVEGPTLHTRLLDGPAFTFRESAEFVKELADAVAYAHSQKVIHRDIKPKNVIIAAEDGKPRLLDFGLARRDVDESITLPHHVLGTPGYMSPEQAGGRSAEVDHRTDIYSLGVVFYQLLTGETPFRGDPRMIMRQVVEEDPRAPRELNAEIPPDLETICQKAMEKEPKKRFQAAAEFAEELERFLQNKPIKSRPITRVERSWRWCKRNPVTSTLVASIAGVLLLSALGATAMYASEHRHRTQVEELLDEKNQLVSEKSELLSKSYVERAGRYLGPPAEQPEFSPMKALPWIYAALENDQHDAKRWEASRSRLGTALRQLPSVRRLWSHKGGILAAAISPKGDRFATAGTNDAAAYVWDVSKDDPITPALVHPGKVMSMNFAGDGKSLATGCDDGSLRIWDAATGKLLYGPLWDAEFARSANLSTYVSVDHQSLLTVRDTHAQVWNAATGHPIGKTLTVSHGSVNLADAGKLVVGLDRNAIVAWDPQTGNEKQRLEAKFVGPITVAPDGITVAVADASQHVQLWNCRTNKKLAMTPAHATQVTALKFSADGVWLASGTNNGTVSVWKSGDGSLVGQRRLGARIAILEFSRDSHQLAAIAGNYGMISIIPLDGREPLPAPIHLPGTIYPAGWIPAKDSLLSFSDNGVVRLWDVKTLRTARQLAHAEPIIGASASKDRQLLATIDEDGTCSITDLLAADGDLTGSAAMIATAMQQPAAVALTSDGSKLAIADMRGPLAIWDTAGRKKVRDLDVVRPQRPRLLQSDVRLVFANNDRLLINVTNRRFEGFCEINVWDVNSGQRLQHQRFESNQGSHLGFSVSGSLCAVALNTRLITWDAATGQQTSPIMLHDLDVTCCRLSSSGSRLISACNDAIARVWDPATGKIVAATIKHPQAIASVSVSPDGQRFVTGCHDGTARIWSTSTGAAMSPRLTHGAPVTGCQYSPDSRWLLTTSADALLNNDSDAVLRVWDAKTGEPLFGMPINLFERQSVGPPTGDPHLASQLEFSCFSQDSRELHLLTHGGTVETVSLEPDARTTAELLREIVIRSGVQPDGAGGLSIVDPDHLSRLFRREADRP